MKKLKGLLVAGVCTLGLIEGVNAATVVIGESTSKVNSRGTLTISLSDDDLANYKEVRFKLSAEVSDKYVELGAVKPIGITFGTNGATEPTYIFTAPKTETGEQTALSAKDIATIDYTTTDLFNADVTITPVEVVFVKKEAKEDGTFEEVTTPTAKIKAGTIKYEREKSPEAYLTDLTLSQGTITPAFNRDTTEYTVQVKDTINQLRISATPCEGATRTGVGIQKLEMGENTFAIEVTSEDGENKVTYTVKVVRGEIAEPSAYLKDIEINNIGVELSPKFDSKNNKYTITLDKELDSLDIKPITEDPLATYTIEGNENFVEGENLITIKVKSSNEEDEQTYEITVTLTKEEEKEEKPAEEPKKEEKKEKNTWLLVGIIAGIVVILGGVAFVLFKNNKKKKKMQQIPPIKKRESEEPTVTNDIVGGTGEITKPVVEVDEEEDEIDIDETYNDNKTQQFDQEKIKEYLEQKYGDDEDLDKTKEFNFHDYE